MCGPETGRLRRKIETIVHVYSTLGYGMTLQEFIPGFPGKTFGRVKHISHHPFSILRAVSEAYTVYASFALLRIEKD